MKESYYADVTSSGHCKGRSSRDKRVDGRGISPPVALFHGSMSSAGAFNFFDLFLSFFYEALILTGERLSRFKKCFAGIEYDFDSVRCE